MGQRSESRAQRGKTLFEIAFELLCTYNLTRHCDLFWPSLLTEILPHPIFTVRIILYFCNNIAIGGAKQNSVILKCDFRKFFDPKCAKVEKNPCVSGTTLNVNCAMKCFLWNLCSKGMQELQGISYFLFTLSFIF